MRLPLPVDGRIPEILAAVREHRRAVVVAPPGAGKTTRIPPALCDDGPVILLQPRRVAARAIARRIASEQGWTSGREVGWHVRFERNFDRSTKLIVATEGILTARLQSDPLLTGFRTIILDEFHERSVHADLAIALSKQAIAARDDLRIVVMSATLDAARVAGFLGESSCPIIEIPGRAHPIEVSYSPGESVASAVRHAFEDTDGDILVFLPGLREIRAAHADLAGAIDAEIHDLHGSLDADAQDAAIAPGSKRKVILSTNIAETSLTVEGVSTVIDTGLQRVLRFNPSIALDRLETERITLDSAIQRSGRAGRLSAGRSIRLWDARDHLEPHREPEILRIDLASTLLEVIAWGDDPAAFEWFELPPADHLSRALELLLLLGAIEGSPPRPTDIGRSLARLPIHPRLGRILIDAGGSRHAAQLAAILSEGMRIASAFDLASAAASDSDALVMLDRFDRAPFHVRRAAREIESIARSVATESPKGIDGEETLRRSILRAFPDRVAMRREEGSDRFLLASGHGAVLARESSVREGQFIVALDVASRSDAEALIRLASRVEAEWLEPTRRATDHRFDDSRSRVRALEIDSYFEIPLHERHVPVDPSTAESMLVDEMRRRIDQIVPPQERNRLQFAGVVADLDALFRHACAGRSSLPDFRLVDSLPWDARLQLDRLAPERIELPSGRNARLEYRDDGSVMAAVKLQELFGLADSPRIGPARQPVLFSLLAPNGRPVQLTSDLRSFWERTYPEVRKELRGRYPKHPWPDDPWTAQPTARTKKRSAT